MIKIEKNIPIPSKGFRKEFKFSFIFEMEVGDSFLLKCTPEELAVKRSRMNSQINYHTKSEGLKFSSRTVEDGVRYWRVK